MTMAKNKPATTATKTETPRSLALEMLAAGASNPEVARALSLNRATLWKWRQAPEFAAELARLRQPILDAVRPDLLAMATRAVDLLSGLLADETAPPAVRLRAAEIVLERSGIDDMPTKAQPTDPLAIARYLVAFHRDLVEAALDAEAGR